MAELSITTSYEKVSTKIPMSWGLNKYGKYVKQRIPLLYISQPLRLNCSNDHVGKGVNCISPTCAMEKKEILRSATSLAESEVARLS